MKYQFWLLLIAAQLVWAMSYAAAKIALESFPVMMVVFLRYGFASMFFLGVWIYRGFPRFPIKLFFGIAAVGMVNFIVSPWLQVHSLQYTQSIDASILVLFEPLVTMILAVAILGERFRKRLLFVTLLAIGGFFLLSDVEFSSIGDWSNLRLLGNLLFMGSLLSEATCSITGKVFTREHSALDVMGLMMVSAFLANGVWNIGTIVSFDYNSASFRSWMSIGFMAIFCSVFAYTIWYKVIKEVEVQVVSLSLFLQPVLGSIVGLVWMGEQISRSSLIGGMVICVSLFWWQWKVSQEKSL
ncbi:MAG: DMT family transporter [Bdellovibrionales bacterium]|nr:DMT family transporter [Bdellovibrionales bacterium]